MVRERVVAPTRLVLLAVLAAFAAMAGPFAAETIAAEDSEAAAAAQPIGAAACRACHALEADHWTPTIHGRLAAAPRSDAPARGCEGCHGPGSRHLADPKDPASIVAFTRGSRAAIEVQNEMCLACHAGGPRIHWPGSMHERQDLACSDCHNPMAETSAQGLLAKRDVNETCLRCHPQQRTELRRRSHMPVLEGKIACSDCHDPHGSATDPLLRADTVVDLCTSCHADKRGPFLWEHAPVRENCLECHQAHGSNHPALLDTALPFLCQACHANTGGFGHPNDLLSRANQAGGPAPDARLLSRGCVGCHVQIHGSNHPSGARLVR
jgi:DmsE family decaheme c-type cytochrome